MSVEPFITVTATSSHSLSGCYVIKKKKCSHSHDCTWPLSLIQGIKFDVLCLQQQRKKNSIFIFLSFISAHNLHIPDSNVLKTWPSFSRMWEDWSLTEVFHSWKDGLVIKPGSLCCRKTLIFLQLLLHDQRKQRKGGLWYSLWLKR